MTTGEKALLAVTRDSVWWRDGVHERQSVLQGLRQKVVYLSLGMILAVWRLELKK